MSKSETLRLRQFGRAVATSDLIPVGEAERVVRVFSISGKALVATLETILDFGGGRLVLQASPTPVVVAAAYHRHGVVAYGLDGETRWQRKDLKKPQLLEPIPDGTISVGMEEKALHLLAASSGETLQTIRGVRRLFHNPYGHLTLAEGRSGSKIVYGYDRTTWSRRWSFSLNSFALLAAAFSPNDILLSEPADIPQKTAGAVTCIDPKGTQKWAWEPPANSHVLDLSWSGSVELWMGILWSFQWGGPKTMVAWTSEGEVAQSVEIGEVVSTAFMGEGQFLATSSGAVLDVPSGREIWAFELEEPEHG
jgi:hypothetical protein